jgi:hypothetical protein
MTDCRETILLNYKGADAFARSICAAEVFATLAHPTNRTKRSLVVEDARMYLEHELAKGSRRALRELPNARRVARRRKLFETGPLPGALNRIDQRLLAAEAANFKWHWNALTQALGQDRRSLTEACELVAHTLPMRTNHFQERIWKPSAPVLHIALALHRFLKAWCRGPTPTLSELRRIELPTLLPVTEATRNLPDDDGLSWTMDLHAMLLHHQWVPLVVRWSELERHPEVLGAFDLAPNETIRLRLK